jgi:hypothetical protein
MVFDEVEVQRFVEDDIRAEVTLVDALRDGRLPKQKQKN